MDENEEVKLCPLNRMRPCLEEKCMWYVQGHIYSVGDKCAVVAIARSR